MVRKTRPISWIKAALKDFGRFPEDAQARALAALTVVADGATPDIAKPLAGLGSGVWELAIEATPFVWSMRFGLRMKSG